MGQIKNLKTGTFLAGATCLLLLFACNNEQKEQAVTQHKSEATAPPQTIAPDFNQDSAYAYVKAQADMGPRTPGSAAHEEAVKYFERKFKSYGAEVQIQKATVTTFDQKKWACKNVIASFDPQNTSRILLCAHWDSRPFCDRDSVTANMKKACPGVNDGASGAGVLIEIARQLAKQKTNVGIDIILWDMEDYGAGQTGMGPEGIEDDWGLGSQYWSKNPHKPGYIAKFGILLDMVGGANTVFPIELNSAYYAGEIQKRIWATAGRLGYGNYFVENTVGEVTDDHLYINKWANIPCVDIIGYTADRRNFFPQHHTERDDLNHIDKNTMKAVGQTVLEVIYNEAP